MGKSCEVGRRLSRTPSTGKFTPVSISITGGAKAVILMSTERKDFRNKGMIQQTISFSTPLRALLPRIREVFYI
jgi:hypothetical protein